MIKNIFHATLSFVFFNLLAISSAMASPEPALWALSDEFSKAQIDHADWQTILSKYVKSDASRLNRFAYGDVDEDDADLLDTYLENMQEVDPRKYSKIEQKAYWINIYNALTVQVILEHYPVESIMQTGENGDEGKGPWDDEVAEIIGMPLTLNNIEHNILRAHWNDPRVHFGVNCASIGCPNLQAKAYTAKNLDQLLDVGAREYLTHARGAHFDDDTLVLSSIFEWFAGDFGKSQQEVLKTLASYLPRDKAKKLENYQGEIKYNYDWRLNSL